MRTVIVLIKRNTKLFFKDKGMFFTSLVTPAILLVLYGTFLGNVYRDSFTAGLPEGLTLPEHLIEGLVGSQLISSILAVSCVTVAFCSNFLWFRIRQTVHQGFANFSRKILRAFHKLLYCVPAFHPLLFAFPRRESA